MSFPLFGVPTVSTKWIPDPIIELMPKYDCAFDAQLLDYNGYENFSLKSGVSLYYQKIVILENGSSPDLSLIF